MVKLIDFLFAMSARLLVIPLFFAGYKIITWGDSLDIYYGPGMWGLVCLPSTLLLGIGVVLALIHSKSDTEFRDKFDVENLGPFGVLAYVGLLLFIWSLIQYVDFHRMQYEFASVLTAVEKKVREQPVETWVFDDNNKLPVPFIPVVYNEETGKCVLTTKFLKGVAKHFKEVKGIFFISCHRVVSEPSSKGIKIKKSWVFDCWMLNYPDMSFYAHKTFYGDEPKGVHLYTVSYTGNQPWESVLKWVSEIRVNKKHS